VKEQPNRLEPLEPLGFWLDTDCIPRARLRRTLPRGLGDEVAERFLDRCAAEAQALGLAAAFFALPEATIRRELMQIAERARRLRDAIGAASDTARRRASLYADELALCRQSSLSARALEAVNNRDELLCVAHELAGDIEAIARYTAGKLTPSRQRKPAERKARLLVGNVACVWREITGKLPPRHRTTWFAEFCAALGEHLGLRIGARLVRSVLLDLAAPKPRPDDAGAPARARRKAQRAARAARRRKAPVPRSAGLRVRTVRLLDR
jgi:hypothetical protein